MANRFQVVLEPTSPFLLVVNDSHLVVMLSLLVWNRLIQLSYLQGCLITLVVNAKQKFLFHCFLLQVFFDFS